MGGTLIFVIYCGVVAVFGLKLVGIISKDFP